MASERAIASTPAQLCSLHPQLQACAASFFLPLLSRLMMLLVQVSLVSRLPTYRDIERAKE